MKFLPFVVEKSPPIHIFQTLLSRSKGINNLLVPSILYLVLEKGITEIRKAANALPEMEVHKMYSELLTTYPDYRILESSYKKIQAVRKLVRGVTPNSIPEQLREYDIEDVMSFLLVMHLSGKLAEYTELPLENLFNGKAEAAENDFSPGELFSDSGESRNFKTREQLAAYIHFYTVISTTKPKPIRAILLSREEANFAAAKKPKAHTYDTSRAAPPWDSAGSEGEP